MPAYKEGLHSLPADMTADATIQQKICTRTCGHPVLRTHHIYEVVKPLAVAGSNVDVGSQIKAHIESLQSGQQLSGNVHGGQTLLSAARHGMVTH